MEITPEFEQRFQAYSLGSQNKVSDPLVVSRLIAPPSPAQWLLIEYSPCKQLAVGFVSGLMEECEEWGHVPLNELTTIETEFGIQIQWDAAFPPQPWSVFRWAMLQNTQH